MRINCFFLIPIVSFLFTFTACSETDNDTDVDEDAGLDTSQGEGIIKEVEFMWLSNASWLVRYGETTIMLDAYFSRPQLGVEGSTSAGKAFLDKILDSGGIGSVDYIVVGHSHFDHAVDVGVAALSTGAQVIGSRTTCMICQAQKLPADRCTVVENGDEFKINEVTVRAVRVIHSDPTGITGEYGELEEVPTPESVSMAPNGGALGYMFITPGTKPFSFFFQDTVGPINGNDGSGVDYEKYLDEFLEEGFNLTLWMGPLVAHLPPEDSIPYIERLSPSWYLPQHWDNFMADPLLGAGTTFALPEVLQQPFLQKGTEIVTPQQYFDRFVLSPDGVLRLEESVVQTAFGF